MTLLAPSLSKEMSAPDTGLPLLSRTAPVIVARFPLLALAVESGARALPKMQQQQTDYSSSQFILPNTFPAILPDSFQYSHATKLLRSPLGTLKHLTVTVVCAIGRSLPRVLAFSRATRQPRLNPQKANWFRPGDLPEPLNGSHFPPLIEALSSNTGPHY